MSEDAICQFIYTPPNAMYDIGVGPKSEWKVLSGHYPSMRLYGCEPHPVMYESLKKSFPGSLCQKAVSNCGQTAVLHMPLDSSNLKRSMRGSLHRLKTTEEEIPVEVITLDQFDVWAGQPDRILLWMDIEGSELDALKSGPMLLASGRVKWINLEERKGTEEELDERLVDGWCRPDEIKRFLEGHGYRPILHYNNQKTHWDVIYSNGSA